MQIQSYLAPKGQVAYGVRGELAHGAGGKLVHLDKPFLGGGCGIRTTCSTSCVISLLGRRRLGELEDLNGRERNPSGKLQLYNTVCFKVKFTNAPIRI